MKNSKINGHHIGKIQDTVNGVDIIECDQCQFKHITPLPTEKELLKFYSEDYFQKDKSSYFDEFQEDIEWWRLVFSDKYDSFEELIHIVSEFKPDLIGIRLLSFFKHFTVDTIKAIKEYDNNITI